MMNELSDRCFAYRVRNNLNQVEMAKLCKVHPLTIHNCESRKAISKMTAAKIAAVIEKEG